MNISIHDFILRKTNVKSFKEWFSNKDPLYYYIRRKIDELFSDDQNFLDKIVWKPPVSYTSINEDVFLETLFLSEEGNSAYKRRFFCLNDLNKAYSDFEKDPNGEILNGNTPVMYIADPKTFKVTSNFYTYDVGFVHDFLSLKNNYFLRFYCTKGLYCGPVDKSVLLSFINIVTGKEHILSVYENSRSHINNFLTQYFLGLRNIYQFKNSFLQNIESLRDYKIKGFSKKIKNFRFQVGRSMDPYFYDPIKQKVSKLEYLIKRNLVNNLRLEKFSDYYSLISRNRSYGNRSKFFDYFIFEEDTSYYVYIWLKLLRIYDIYFLEKQLKSVELLFKSLKNLDKSRKTTDRFITSFYKFGIEI